MTTNKPPKVSLGLPVYNGERFVGDAIQSTLNQTFTDFELIISDNASTDSTRKICEHFASKDSRVRYFRQPTNLGAKANFNRVFDYSHGEYFKWIACDDVCGPRYLELTVAALDQNPTAVLAHTKSDMINSKGEVVPHEALLRGVVFDEGIPVRVQPVDGARALDHALPHRRFQDILLHTFWCFEIFALIRREAMLRTYPKRPYYGSDKVMLAELSLLGRFIEVPEVQFYRRAHYGNSTNLNNNNREGWSHGSKWVWKLPSQVPCLNGYTAAALTFPLNFVDRIRCLGVIGRYLSRPDRYRSVVRQMFGIRPKPVSETAAAPTEKVTLDTRMPLS
ncbi:MAG TPA: glycosyltransferase family A protein [Candidatus Acidoferrum sp.]